MSDKSKDDTFLARWLSGDLSAEEKAAFEAREDAELLRKIADTAEHLHLPQRDQEASWEALQQKVTTGSAQAPIRRLSTWWRYAAAAVVILIAGYFFLLDTNSWKTVQAPLAQKMVYELPDGSEVWLNAGSEIQFNEKTFTNNRRLELQGEAYFDVERGDDFEVITPGGSVAVLGTSFNVFARSERFQVVCYTGRVGVRYSETADSEILGPGDEVEVVNEQLNRRKTTEQVEMPEWTSGNSKFTGVPFSQVIQELERQYDLTVNYPTSLDTIVDYSGGFPHRDLETALRIVFSSVDHQYEIEGSKIEVSPSSE